MHSKCIEHSDILFTKTNNIVVKTSPLIDLEYGLTTLKNVIKIVIVSIKNEVKELLWFLNKNYEEQNPEIICCNIINTKIEEFIFNYREKEVFNIPYSIPLKYL